MKIRQQFAEDQFMTKEAQPVRDVADFHLRWLEFRPSAQEIVQLRSLNRRQAETLTWMIDLIDRIGEGDIAAG
jgi:hypothetical protein